jgi:NDP-sugar pyrophosphorylase family protein
VKCMILAAGSGTRLLPLTQHTPKPMLPVAGRPTLEWIVAWLRQYDVRDIVINLYHLADRVVDYFGDGRAWDVHLAYSIEETILGTAGGIKRVERLFDGPILVVYGDVLTDLHLPRLLAFHAEQGPAPHATIGLWRSDRPWECGVVDLAADGRVTRFVEKPPRDQIFSHWTNSGVLILDRRLLEHVPRDQFYDISHDLLPRLLQEGVPLYAQPIEEEAYLIDMGTPEAYQRAQREWPHRVAFAPMARIA